MNLTKLFETQAELDKKIIEEKGLQGKDLLDEKILALQVELGELANELPEVFKFWSNKQNDYEKALKEYVDGLHFILSIGNDLNIQVDKPEKLIIFAPDVLGQLNAVFRLISMWDKVTLLIDEHPFRVTLNNFLSLGEMLGFTWEQIEQAYYEKNEINHARQANGY